jgi:hypothetical protein
MALKRGMGKRELKRQTVQDICGAGNALQRYLHCKGNSFESKIHPAEY